MIWVAWRQSRTQSLVAAVLLAAVAVLLGTTGPHLAHVYDVYERAVAACSPDQPCLVSARLSRLDSLLELFGAVLAALPGLLGAFWGAPLITRELEHGTHRLAWTQSVTRTRWLLTKLLLVGLASVVVTGLLSLMVTWWSSPLDTSDANRFGAGLFGERNVAPLGYAAFAFALGVIVGVLVRRTVPAMAVTLGLFLAVRLAFTYLVRPRLMAARHLASALNPSTTGFGIINGNPATLTPQSPHLPNAWIYSTHIVDASGHGLTAHALSTICPNIAQQLPIPAGPGTVHVAGGPVPTAVQAVVNQCVTKVATSYHVLTTYQPASRYWIFQWYETAIFVALALALAAGCVWWVRRRLS